MSEKELLISFIIPAYNAEKTLKKCVDSIMAEPDDRIEAIIVENGSSDHTWPLACSLQEKDNRIRIFSSEKGVSRARNKGLEEAQGRWIAFVDADDYVSSEKMQVLISDAEHKKTDLILYGHHAGRNDRPVNTQKENLCYSGGQVEEFRAAMLRDPTRYMQVWAKLFKRQLIHDHKVLFNPAISFSEDSDFTFRFSRYCRSIELSTESIYHYVLEPASAMRCYDGKKAEGYALAMKAAAAAARDERRQIKDAFYCYVAMHINILMVREIFSHLNPSSGLEKYQKMIEVTRIPIFSKTLKALKKRDCRNVRMVPIFFLKLKLYPLAAAAFTIRAEQNRRKEIKG